MIRAAELALFLVPVVVLVLWWVAVSRGMAGPSPRSLLLMLVSVVALGVLLLTLSVEEALPPGRYVPAQLRGGSVVSGHSE